MAFDREAWCGAALEAGWQIVRGLFFNEHKAPVRLYWMDRMGGKKLYATIASGRRKRQRTRPGAVWLITTTEDGPLGFFTIGDRPARGVVRE